jgi:hypothetical protein
MLLLKLSFTDTIKTRISILNTGLSVQVLKVANRIFLTLSVKDLLVCFLV